MAKDRLGAGWPLAALRHCYNCQCYFCRANEGNQMTDKTPIQRIKELDQERATLFEQAKEEALRRANQAVEDLNALGLNYRLVTGSAPSGSKAAAKQPPGTGQTGADKKRGARPPA
jgi:hypothetical protein